MSNGNKVILSIVLLIAAAGILTWHFKSNNKPRHIPEPPEVIMNTKQVKALETIVAKVGSKKWSDPSLWTSPKAASTYGALAEKLFTSKPSMDTIKVLDFGTDKENDDALLLVLETPGSEMCVTVEFKPKGTQNLLDIIRETQLKVSDFRNR